MKATLRFPPSGGTVGCLHTELIDLRQLGRLHVVRATRIVFDPGGQSWQVRDARSGALLFADGSRAACLRWERDHLVPGPDGPLVLRNPSTNPNPNPPKSPTHPTPILNQHPTQ